jgi:uncharacterized protein YuzE
MKIEYDQEANALYITLREAPVAGTNEVTESFIIDLDAEGRPIGIEILDVRQLLNPEDLARVTVENLLAEAAAASGPR